MHFPARNITGLPETDKASLAHSLRVEAAIRAAIRDAGGALPFSRFMHMALYEPGLGYYVAGQQRFGAGGDFVTAPELGNLFGQCLASQVSQILVQLREQGTAGDVVEFGAGSGRLAVSLLTELAALDRLPSRYRIVEPSPDLRERQRALLEESLPGYLERVEWTDSVAEHAFSGVVIANEVLDAMPVELISVDEEKGVQQGFVALQGDAFGWTVKPADEPLARQVQHLDLPAGYTSEINTALPGWVAMLSDWLEKGVVLLIDYGFPRHEYYHPQRGGGTLMCHYRHHSHTDPLRLVGIQDITAHVDFTAVAEAADATGFEVQGFTNQAGFLIGNGLTQRLAGLIREDHASQAKINHEVQMLTSPAEMGELFKVMALGKSYDGELDGFVFRDMRGRL
jgi:SAM-dependent MidA family methyltransferase